MGISTSIHPPKNKKEREIEGERGEGDHHTFIYDDQ